MYTHIYIYVRLYTGKQNKNKTRRRAVHINRKRRCWC